MIAAPPPRNVVASSKSIESAEANSSTVDSLPPAPDPRPRGDRLLRLAFLKTAVGELEAKILTLRNECLGRAGDSLEESRQLFFFRQKFGEFRHQIRGFRDSYEARHRLLAQRGATLAEEGRRRDERIAALDKRLLLVSLEFSSAKKEHAQRAKKGLLSKLFGGF